MDEVGIRLSVKDRAQFARETRGAAGDVEGIGKAADRSSRKTMSLAQRMNRAGVMMVAAGKKLFRYVTLPIIGLGVASFRAFTKFREGLANVATLIPGQQRRIDSLGKTVQKLSVRFASTTDDLTEGLYQTISAFGDLEGRTEKILATATKAGKAGKATTLEALNLLSAVTKGYGDTSAKAVKHASDLAFITVKLGQTTFPELASSIGRVVPLAAKLNVAQEELFAGFATLTGVTGSAAEVSTQLAGIQRALIRPTTDMKTAIKDLGFESASTLVKERGLVGSLRDLIKTTDGTEESVGKLFGEAESLTAVFALTGSQADTFDQKLKQLRKSSGATDEAFKEQTKGVNALGFQWEKFKRRVDVFLQRTGAALEPTFKSFFRVFDGFLKKVSAGVRWFGRLDEGQRQNLIKFGLWAAAAGPMLIVVGKIVGAVGSLVKVLGAAKALSLASVLNPAGLVIGGLALLAAGLWKIKNASKAAEQRTKDLTEAFLTGKETVRGYRTQIDKLRAEREADRGKIDWFPVAPMFGGRNIAQEIKSAEETLEDAQKRAIRTVRERREEVKLLGGALGKLDRFTLRSYIVSGHYPKALEFLAELEKERINRLHRHGRALVSWDAKFEGLTKNHLSRQKAEERAEERKHKKLQDHLKREDEKLKDITERYQEWARRSRRNIDSVARAWDRLAEAMATGAVSPQVAGPTAGGQVPGGGSRGGKKKSGSQAPPTVLPRPRSIATPEQKSAVGAGVGAGVVHEQPIQITVDRRVIGETTIRYISGRRARD